ncbi:MAG: T9SS type A sorting domain-containing protein [Candidatus Cloacimonetes bacterium]|nr:T9SS type A sorting domain-containing protein [Candidatus Cloacimonadota bacterium]
MKQLLVLAVLLTATLCHAQWSDDPLVNNAICTLTGDQAIPKVAACPDGSNYIAWFDHSTGNFNVRLQLLDYQGNPQWADNGILVSDHPQMSWLTDWDMRTDSQGNAILAFQDIRLNDNPDMFVYKIAPDGSFLWGADGVALTDDDESNSVAQLAVTDADNVIVCWLTETVVRVQKISADGIPQLATPLTLGDASDMHTRPQVIATAGDTFILKYFKDTGVQELLQFTLFAQKYDTDVAPVWTGEVALTTQGGISGWSLGLPLVNDGQDGLWTAWYDDHDANMIEQAFVQHLAADGTLSFADGGVLLSTNAGNQLYMPSITLAPDGVYAFWMETDYDQINSGITGQLVADDGSLQWSDTGVALLPIGDQEVYPVGAQTIDGEAVMVFRDDTSSYHIKAMRVDAAGNFVWPTPISDISLAASVKNLAFMSGTNNQQWVVAWGDNRNGDANADIYAQNLNADGTLGPTQSVSDDPPPLPVLSASPNPFNPETTLRFSLTQPGQARLDIFNVRGRRVATLLDEPFPAGSHSVTWEACGLASGVYLARLTTPAGVSATKLLLLK